MWWSRRCNAPKDLRGPQFVLRSICQACRLLISCHRGAQPSKGPYVQGGRLGGTGLGHLERMCKLHCSCVIVLVLVAWRYL